MLEQVFINDEQASLKRERELFREYEGKWKDLGWICLVVCKQQALIDIENVCPQLIWRA